MAGERVLDIVDPFNGVPLVLAVVVAPAVAYVIVWRTSKSSRKDDALIIALAVSVLSAIGLVTL